MQDTRGGCQPRLDGYWHGSAHSNFAALEAVGPPNQPPCLSPSPHGGGGFSSTPSNARAHHNGRVFIKSAMKTPDTFDMSAAYMEAIQYPIDPRMSLSAFPAPLALKAQPASSIPVKSSRVASGQALCQAPSRALNFAPIISRASPPNPDRGASRPRRLAYKAPTRSPTPNPVEHPQIYSYTITAISDLIEQNLKDIPILKRAQKNTVRGVKFKDEVERKPLMKNNTGGEHEINFDAMEQNILDFKKFYDSVSFLALFSTPSPCIASTC